MKSMTKKVVALSATFALAASFAASAATIENVVATAESADNITVTYQYNGGAADGQATILVYEGETPFAGGTGDNVGYINQDTATGSFTFAMRDTLVPQTGSKEFKVLVGGTDVATAGTATFALGTAAPTTTYSISGTVGAVANYSDGELAAAYAPTIEITDLEYNPIGNPIAIDVSSLGEDAEGNVPFKVDGLEFGKSYILAFKRAGACPREVTLNSSINADVSDVNVELWGSDVNDDYEITATDVNGAIALFNAGNYEYAADANLDGDVNATDVNAIIYNFSRFDEYPLSFGE